MHIIFFPTGMTACFDEKGEQVPDLQQSWLRIYLNWLDEHDVDPTTVTITMPDGSQAKPYATDDGFSWEWAGGYRPKP